MLGKKRLYFIAHTIGLHFIASCVVATIFTWSLVSLWIPHPYQDILKSHKIFTTLALTTVIGGPSITAVIVNPLNSFRKNTLIFLLVTFLQISAFSYGLYIFALSRPVVIAFERDRFVLVTASQIHAKELLRADQQYQSLSWQGPVLLGTRSAKSSEEKLYSIELSLQGIEPSARPSWWQSYELNRPQVIARMHPLYALHRRISFEGQQLINAELKKLPYSLEQVFYLPLTSAHKQEKWIVLLDEQANILGYAAVDGFQ